MLTLVARYLSLSMAIITLRYAYMAFQYTLSLIRNYVTTQKWRKVWGPFVQRAIGKKPKADRRTTREVRKCVPLHSKIVNKPHQSFLMLSSRGTSRNVIPSIQSIPTLFAIFALFSRCDVIADKAHRNQMTSLFNYLKAYNEIGSITFS